MHLIESERRYLSFSVFVGGYAIIIYLLSAKLIDRSFAAFLFVLVIVLTGILSYK